VNADGAGNWTATYSNTEITPGEYTADITATTTDSAGNTLNATDSVRVDTRVNNLSINGDTVEGDGVINAAERLEGGGVQVTGTTEVGSTSVVVTLNGVAVNAVVQSNGNWTATYASSQVAEGTYDATVTADATDAAGNTLTVTDSIRVDTEVLPLNMTNGGGGADNVANAAEAAVGIDLGGQVEVGSSVVVNFDGTNYDAAVDQAGNWSLTIPPSGIRAGTYDAPIRVTATDSVNNVDTINDVLAIDTDAPDGPVIVGVLDATGGGIGSVVTQDFEGELSVSEVAMNGSITDVNRAPGNPDDSNFYDFETNVPDGSNLVVSATDAAGNTTGTYVALDPGSAGVQNISLSTPGLNDFNIETIELGNVEDGQLTIDEELLLALSANSNTLQINGGQDDTVTITGATQTGSENGFDIYTLGEGTLYIDADIDVNGVI
jgi:hypothetical protein